MIETNKRLMSWQPERSAGNEVATVTYAIGTRIGGGGIGDIAAQAVQSLVEAGILERLLVLGGRQAGAEDRTNSFPEWLVRNRLAARYLPDGFIARLFDRWASLHLGTCRVFYGWAGYSLACIDAGNRRSIATVVDRASVEARTQYRLLEDERRLFGLLDGPMDLTMVHRMVEEYNTTDLVAVPSTFVYDTFRERGYPAEKLFLNPLGVDLVRFSPPCHTADRFRVIFLGQVGLRKGVVHLLRAWNRLGLRDAELLIIGPIERAMSSIILEEIRQIPAGAGRLLGPTGTPEEYLRQGSVLVLPSVEDGFGLVVLEAMACGLPVVVSEHVGAKECVRDGVDGFVIPVRDVEALIQRLEWLAADPARRLEMGRQARSRAEEFSWAAYRDRLVTRLLALAGERIE